MAVGHWIRLASQGQIPGVCPDDRVISNDSHDFWVLDKGPLILGGNVKKKDILGR
jgi:hypothetical protein